MQLISHVIGLELEATNRSPTGTVLRLRKTKDGDFFDYNPSLGTMLHELCHNRHGPHNQQFYALLDELWEEEQSAGLGVRFVMAEKGMRIEC